MHSSLARMFVLCATASIALTLQGCASTRQIVEQGVKANLSVEDAHNQILLLNIVRAYERRPMHFTRFQNLKGPLGIGATTFTLPVPFGPDFTTQIYNFSAQYTPDRPSYDVQILDTQKFVLGITKPVSPRTMLYYLDQGWPQQMVLHLFVREIEVFDADGKRVKHFLNYPQNKDEFQKFQKALADMEGCEFIGDEDRRFESYGPVLATDEVRDLKKLVDVKTADLVLTPVDGSGKPIDESKAKPAGYRLQKKSSQLTFKLEPERLNAPCTSPAGSDTKVALFDREAATTIKLSVSGNPLQTPQARMR